MKHETYKEVDAHLTEQSRGILEPHKGGYLKKRRAYVYQHGGERRNVLLLYLSHAFYNKAGCCVKEGYKYVLQSGEEHISLSPECSYIRILSPRREAVRIGLSRSYIPSPYCRMGVRR